MITSLEETLAVYDGILAKQAYLAGDELTLADLFHLSYGTMIKDIGFGSSFDKFPNVKKWFEGLQARESWKSVPNTMEFFAAMKAGGGH
jgi:glutathione S-transferase